MNFKAMLASIAIGIILSPAIGRAQVNNSDHHLSIACYESYDVLSGDQSLFTNGIFGFSAMQAISDSAQPDVVVYKGGNLTGFLAIASDITLTVDFKNKTAKLKGTVWDRMTKDVVLKISQSGSFDDSNLRLVDNTNFTPSALVSNQSFGDIGWIFPNGAVIGSPTVQFKGTNSILYPKMDENYEMVKFAHGTVRIVDFGVDCRFIPGAL